MRWWQRFWQRKEMDEQLEKELGFHLEQHAADLIAQGYTPEEARRRARLALGGLAQVEEACREARETRWLEDLLQDFRYALRTLWHKPAFTIMALLTLALGIGATTIMFTVINGVLLKPLPYLAPERIVVLQEKTDWSTQFGDLWAFAYPNYLDCKNQVRSLDLTAFAYNGGTVTASGGHAEYVDAFEISSDLFPVLGVHVIRGRDFTPDDDRPGAAPVAIISYGLWQRFFGQNPAVIGMPLVFEHVKEEKVYTIAGVAPLGFQLEGAPSLGGEPDIFTPLGQDTGPAMQRRDWHPGIKVWGRLHPGAKIEDARTELAVLGHQLAAEYPKSNKGRTFIADPLRPEVGDARSTLYLLFGAVGLVLLIACVNVASLLLTRAITRERELAVRAALGAGRGRLVRQCLTESAVLGLAGGALGLFLASVGLRPFVAFWPGSLPRAAEVHLDWHVLLFVLGASLLSSVLFGLAPALRAPTSHLERALRTGARSVTGSSRRLHSGFVISEIGLAIVLLVAAGILGRTLLRLASKYPGVDVHNVLTARIALSSATLKDPALTRAAWNEVLRNLGSVPGVEAVATVDTVPMREGSNTIQYATTAAKPAEGSERYILANSVSPDYLKVMSLALRRGRFLAEQDQLGREGVVVIDEAMAQQAFPGEDPIGKHLWIGPGSDPVRVVGVVDHVLQSGPAGDVQAKVRAQLYYPFAQVPDNYLPRWSQLMSIAVRTHGDPRALLESMRLSVRGAGDDQVLYQVRTLEELSDGAIAQQRFLLLLFAIFAGLALLLACVGIYGVLAYLTSQRVPEIGVRMALGASPRGVIWLILRQSLGMILTGAAVGIAGAWGAAKVLERTVTGVQSMEPLAFVATVCLLITAALLASFVPARRASRIDPVIALRQE
jgi:predicted permease